MEYTHTSHEEHHESGKGEVKRVTIILSVLTIIELALGFWMMKVEDHGMRLGIKGVIIILMMAKAFYIVAYFMHLKHELKNMIMTIVVPLLLFVWFIIAFLYDGDSYLKYRMTHDRYKNEKSKEKAPAEHQKDQPTKHGGTAQ
jgi:cytochrome c oxidase subunit IV